MKFISRFVKNILSTETIKPLGRWKLEECNKLTNYKIDLANEDHCGVCSQYASVKIQSIKDKDMDMLDREYKRYRMNMNYPDSYFDEFIK
jgi:hypothetical protein